MSGQTEVEQERFRIGIFDASAMERRDGFEPPKTVWLTAALPPGSRRTPTSEPKGHVEQVNNYFGTYMDLSVHYVP
jgi:hypothetical protein